MFTVWIGRLLFGATICLGVLDHSSNAISPEQSRAEEMIKVLRQTLGLKVGLPVPKKRSRKVPQFMLDLHDKEVNDPEWISRFLKTTGKQTTSNIIRAIRNEVGDHLPIPASRRLPANRLSLLFNVSSLRSGETLTAAALRMSFSVVQSASNATFPNKENRVNVYQVLSPGTAGHPAITRLIDTKVLAVDGEEIFDITPAVHHWSLHPKENFGLQVHLVTTGDSPMVHMNNDEESATSDKGPFLVTFSHDKAQHVHRQSKRPSMADRSTTRTSTPCQRHPMTIDFDEFYGDANPYIQPQRYDAFYCDGECQASLAVTNYGTTHAFLQHQMSSLEGSTIPSFCCFPTRMGAISMLYFQDDGTTVVRADVDNMVVLECGCKCGSN